MTPKQEMRVLIALVAQPVVAAAAAFVLFPAFDSTRGDAAISVAFGAAIAAVFVVIFGALPAIGVLSRRWPITLTASLIAGAVLGNAPAAVILLLAAATGNLVSSDAPVAHALIRSVAFGSSVGLACGAAFWAVAGARLDERRPTARV